MLRRAFIASALLASLAACGFQLRGPKPMPFQSIKLEMDPYADLTAYIKRSLKANGTTQVVDKTAEADVILVVAFNTREKVITAINSSGAVSEYKLLLRFGFRLINKSGQEVTSLSVINLQRDVSFNDSQVLAKESEEAQMYVEMEKDLAQQLIRRLSATKMLPAS